MRDNTRNTKKKLLAAGVAVALGAGMVGVGANLDYATSITGNQFRAVATDVDPDEREGVLLRVEGSAIDHDFDVTQNRDSASATWRIVNVGAETAQFAANFADQQMDEALAKHLTVTYTVGGETVAGGTLLEPTELTAATGISDTLASGAAFDVTVEVTLEDPAKLLEEDGVSADDPLSVVANWNVDYIAAS